MRRVWSRSWKNFCLRGPTRVRKWAPATWSWWRASHPSTETGRRRKGAGATFWKFWRRRGSCKIKMFCLCIKLYKWEVCTRERSGAKIRVRNLKTTNPRKISFRFEKHQSWVEKLPDFLCAGQVPAKLVEACLELVRKGHEGLQEGLKNHVELILGTCGQVWTWSTNRDAFQIIYQAWKLQRLTVWSRLEKVSWTSFSTCLV